MNLTYDNLDFNILQINATTPSTLYFLILALIFIILYLIFFSSLTRDDNTKSVDVKNDRTTVHTKT